MSRREKNEKKKCNRCQMVFNIGEPEFFHIGHEQMEKSGLRDNITLCGECKLPMYTSLQRGSENLAVWVKREDFEKWLRCA